MVSFGARCTGVSNGYSGGAALQRVFWSKSFGGLVAGLYVAGVRGYFAGPTYFFGRALLPYEGARGKLSAAPGKYFYQREYFGDCGGARDD